MGRVSQILLQIVGNSRQPIFVSVVFFGGSGTFIGLTWGSQVARPFGTPWHKRRSIMLKNRVRSGRLGVASGLAVFGTAWIPSASALATLNPSHAAHGL